LVNISRILKKAQQMTTKFSRRVACKN